MVPPHVAQAHSTPRGWGTQYKLMPNIHVHLCTNIGLSILIPTRMGHPTYIKPKYGRGQHTYTTPACVGQVSHIPISVRVGGPTPKTLLPHVAESYSSPCERGTQHTFMAKYGCAQHAYATPVCMWGPTHKRYLLMSPKRTHPHTDGAPNIH